MSDNLDPLEGLLEKYRYIQDIVLKYTRKENLSDEKWDLLVDQLTPSQRDEIAELYLHMARQGDAEGLSVWIRAKKSEMIHGSVMEVINTMRGPKGAPFPENPAYNPPIPRAYRIFTLFDRLAKHGFSPFTSKEVEYRLPPDVLDWSKLPPRIRYLIGPAEKWGPYSTFDMMVEMAKKMTPAEYGEMVRLAQKLRNSFDQQLAIDWQGRQPDSPEGQRIYNVIRVLTQFVPEDGTPGLYKRLKQGDWLEQLLEQADDADDE